MAAGTKDDPWELKTAPGTSAPPVRSSRNRLTMSSA